MADEAQQAKSSTDPGTPSDEYLAMEAIRSLPRMLDSTRLEGGVNRILTDPGSRLFEQKGGKKVLKPSGGIGDDGLPLGDLTNLPGQLGAVSRRPLLIQHEVEGNQDFAFRSSIAAPRNAFWHAVEALAGRPFRQLLNVKNAPEVLMPGGEWLADADGRGNSLRSLASAMARSSAGYGLGGYHWVDFDATKARPFVRTIPPELVTRVFLEGPFRRRLHARMSRACFEKPEDRFNPSAMPGTETMIMVFRDGDPQGTSEDEKYASYEVYEQADKEGRKFSTTPDPQTVDGKRVARVSLAPHVRMPLVACPTGKMSETHFVLPPLLDAAQLDYLLLQLSSNLEYASIVANTFLRFAKGISKAEIADWQTIGPQLFYATTSETADMKWVTLGGKAIKSGMDLIEFVLRAIEVAGLAPMLTRSPGDERATGQAIASARAISVAESMALQWQGSTTQVANMMRLHTGSTDEITVGINHDMGLSPDAIDHGNLLSRLYLDPKGGVDSLMFWSELRRIGVISEEVDVEALARASRDPQLALDQEKVNIDKAGVLTGLIPHGHFITRKGAEALYRALSEFGILPDTALTAMLEGDDKEAKEAAKVVDGHFQALAEQYEIGRRRLRNERLFMVQQVEQENYWAGEVSDDLVDINLKLEEDAAEDRETGSEGLPGEDVFGADPNEPAADFGDEPEEDEPVPEPDPTEE